MARRRFYCLGLTRASRLGGAIAVRAIGVNFADVLARQGLI
jgi:hypothetical protein